MRPRFGSIESESSSSSPELLVGAVAVAGHAPEATAIRGYVTVKGGDVPAFDFAGGSWVVTSEGSRVVARRAAEEGCAGCVVA